MENKKVYCSECKFWKTENYVLKCTKKVYNEVPVNDTWQFRANSQKERTIVEAHIQNKFNNCEFYEPKPITKRKSVL